MNITALEKQLIANRSFESRNAAHDALLVIKYAATPDGAAKLLAGGKHCKTLADAAEVVALSQQCEDLWGNKNFIEWNGTATRGKFLKEAPADVSHEKLFPHFAEASHQIRIANMHLGMSLSDVHMKRMMETTLHVKFAPGETQEGFIAGWASTPDLDSYRHVVAKGAFDASIKARGLVGPRSIKLLIGHNWNQLGGVIYKLENRGARLWIEAQMNTEIGYVKDAYLAAKAIGGTNFSVGFLLQEYEYKETAAGVEYMLITKGDLFEVSVVPFPGNEAATMEIIR
ncbi:hypothetical protein BBJ66_31195 [Rhizobium sp. RSm-3]|uniref:HK97 family phage prohead protease n=1 Tax=unclassified Rhizobium TaxID=2613769 RepID=UPI0008DADC28|nr:MULTISPECIES: HK97 family phage prohead protease [unclassified Rhizobium]OHV21429.1 hypothetical protein BBJ66_31195 [Rhizobium sp. RSm-3]